MKGTWCPDVQPLPALADGEPEAIPALPSGSVERKLGQAGHEVTILGPTSCIAQASWEHHLLWGAHQNLRGKVKSRAPHTSPSAPCYTQHSFPSVPSPGRPKTRSVLLPSAYPVASTVSGTWETPGKHLGVKEGRGEWLRQVWNLGVY